MDTIKAARKAAKLSQAEVATRIGVAQPTVSGWENGDYCPDLKNIIAMCDLFGVTPNRLLGYEDSSGSEYSDAEVRLIMCVREVVERGIIKWGHIFDVMDKAGDVLPMSLKYGNLDREGQVMVESAIIAEGRRMKADKTPASKSSAG